MTPLPNKMAVVETCFFGVNLLQSPGKPITTSCHFIRACKSLFSSSNISVLSVLETISRVFQKPSRFQSQSYLEVSLAFFWRKWKNCWSVTSRSCPKGTLYFELLWNMFWQLTIRLYRRRGRGRDKGSRVK